jgi:predicted HAD superfamily phosphohydrolase YqeG
MGGLLYFEQQAFRFTDTLVILDVDGTIVADCGQVASGAVIAQVNALKAAGNEIRLCSNSRRGNYDARLARLAEQLGVGVCPVAVRKPSTRAIAGLDRNGRALVVIGDKDLTDGLLARRADACFIKVLRKLDPRDRLSSRMANLFDNTCGPIAMFLWDALSRLSIRL